MGRFRFGKNFGLALCILVATFCQKSENNEEKLARP